MPITRALRSLIHRDFHGAVANMTPTDRFLFLSVHSVDKLGMWHRLPVLLGLSYLAIRRRLHRRYNLLHVEATPPLALQFNPADYPYRTADGKYNDQFYRGSGGGSNGSFFGRNMPSSSLDDHKDKIMRPDPMLVATKLLCRKRFKDTGKQFNMIAASWIQFMVHDWVDHMEDTNHNQIELSAPREVASKCPLGSFKFFKTAQYATGSDHVNNGSPNLRTPWWDGSAIYGSNEKRLGKVRSFKDGKLKILEQNGLLVHDQNGTALSGDIRNSWAGVSALQALFIKEHNSVCDALKEHSPELNDEELFRHARLVTCAVIAKVHTIDWTVELLKTDTLLAGMRSNWYGLLGKKFKDRFGHFGGASLGGLVGLKKPNNYNVPYSLTEEFVSVYRMHSVLPDYLNFINISEEFDGKSPRPVTKIPMPKLVGLEGEKLLSQIGFASQFVSMGLQSCGALELWNYPTWARDLIAQNIDGTDRPDRIDLAALEIYRDRERNVPRYNEFRRGLLLIPISKWGDLTDDEEAIKTLEQVYGDDVEELDLMVGLMAEKKISGFAISETAFIVFLLMASRRLEADRLFTSEYNEETYTKRGLKWVNETESLKEVIDRHYPEMTRKWIKSSSAFSVWDSTQDAYNPIPLYFRIPKCTPGTALEPEMYQTSKPVE